MREFSSFGTFARHLAALALEGDAVAHHITEKAAKHVHEDAQKRIGEYHDYTGPFNTWAQLTDATQADRERQGFTPNDPLLRSGDLLNSIEYEVHHNEAVVGSASDIALYQEVGTDRIPPRPFLGPALYDAKNAIGEMAGETVVAWVAGLGWKRPQIKFP